MKSRYISQISLPTLPMSQLDTWLPVSCPRLTSSYGTSFESNRRNETMPPAVPSAVVTIPYGCIPMARLFLITLLLLSSSPVYAEWVKVSDSDEAGKTVYVDPATIRRTSNLVKMWQFYDYTTVQTVGGVRFLTAEEQWEFDCVEERSRVVALKQFSGNMGSGTMVFTNSQVGKWVPVEPGSIGQTVWKVACGKK